MSAQKHLAEYLYLSLMFMLMFIKISININTNLNITSVNSLDPRVQNKWVKILKILKIKKKIKIL